MLAELPPAAEAEVHPRIARIVVAALDGLVRVVLVAEAHEAVIVPETTFSNYWAARWLVGGELPYGEGADT